MSGMMRWYRRLDLLRKSLIIYLFFSLIPSFLLGALFYRNLNDELFHNQSEQRENMLDQAVLNYMNYVTRISTVPDLLQSNALVREFLAGETTSVSDEVYAFIQYVRPGISYIYLSYPEIQNMSIYNDSQYSIRTYNPVRPYEELDPAIRERVTKGGLKQTLWAAYCDQGQLCIRMYKQLLNTGYTRAVGILEIEVDPLQMLSPFTAIEGSRMLFQTGDALFAYENGKFSQIDERPPDAPMENEVVLPVPDITVTMQALDRPYPDRQVKLFIVQMALLLALITAQYALYTITFGRRLRRFAQHIDATAGTPRLYETNHVGQDEIDRTISAYNALTIRIRDLIQNEYMMEIKKREADYYALLAQIKPHFIFNTLENIRMSALVAGDMQVADMLCALANFIRYNAQTLRHVTLGQELENARQYLNIFSYRAGGAFRWSERLETNVERLLCPQFILQPVIENTIEHGREGRSEALCLDIRVWERGRYVFVVIRDNGAGIPPDRLRAIQAQLAEDGTDIFQVKEPQKGGIGLRNVNQRLRLFFGPDCGLSVKSREDEFTECILTLRKAEE